MAVRWLLRAGTDLQAIREYIAQDNPSAARSLARRVRDAADQLDRFPELGRAGPVAGTRELIVSNAPYVVAYRISDDGNVEILAVLHGAREWPREF